MMVIMFEVGDGSRVACDNGCVFWDGILVRGDVGEWRGIVWVGFSGYPGNCDFVDVVEGNVRLDGNWIGCDCR